MPCRSLPDILGDIPERWHYVDDAQSVESQFSVGAVEASLRRYQTQTFWERT
ncbi:HipA family kinase [Rhizobium leguminosarum]|uniref:HipA family kinase n=1 Tax=Rhizobium leguminosarum TaxID=384 RepID=UPI0039657A4E